MTAAEALLTEAARAGVILFRIGDRVRWRAPAPPPAGLLARLRAHKRELLPLVSDAPPDRHPAFADVDAFLVESRVLGEAVWLAPDEPAAEALERELAAAGDHRLVFSATELLPLARILDADRRTLLGVLARIKRALSGATLENVTPRRGVPQ